MAPRLDSICLSDAAVQCQVAATETTTTACKLPGLAPTALEPQCVSERGRALVALAKIEAIRVRHDATKDTFVVELFAADGCCGDAVQRAVHIPTRRTSRACLSAASRYIAEPTWTRKPTFVIEKDLAAFARLRDALYNTALGAHSRVLYCDYCHELINYALWGHRTPSGMGARLLFKPEREDPRAVDALTSFLSELLVRSLHPEVADRCCGREDSSRPCHAQARVPIVAHAFLQLSAGLTR